MATFYDNLRASFGNQPFTKYDPITQKKWQQADITGFEEDIRSGKVPTADSKEKEYNTLSLMDTLYAKLSDQFQNYFYGKYIRPDAKDGDEEDIPDDVIEKEASDFLKAKIDSGELDYDFANGKTFLENFYEYGYDTTLLPNTSANLKGTVRDRPLQMPSGNWVTGLKKQTKFPFRMEIPQYDTVNRRQKNSSLL